MKVALFTLGAIATLAVATASSIGAVQGQPQVSEVGPEIATATPEAGFVPGIRAETGPGTTSPKTPSLTNSGIDFVADIAKGFKLSQFGGLGFNPGSLGHGGASGLVGGLGEAGLGGLGHSAGLENIYGSLLGSGGIGFLEAAPFLGLGGGRGGVGYSSVKTYNKNYNFDSNDPSNGAKQV